VFTGPVTYVYPTLTGETRTVPVRVELTNAGGLLKPGMFTQVELSAAPKGAVLTVPTSAVIDSGRRQIVLVQVKEGRFEPREVKVGARSEDRIQILEGVQDGEMVVVAANFLIDAESNLKAAIGGFASAEQGKGAAPESSTKPQGAGGVGHQAEGTVEDVDAKSTVTLAHGPVPSLKWPAMSMEFKVAHSGLLKELKPGALVAFEFVERDQGEWVITAARPLGKATANPHAGHN
jgi:Cu(I)/Ag(I) efflux system membrane fusion protein/cobalt-zinc-cadmium efflux system membrane fusion protein